MTREGIENLLAECNFCRKGRVENDKIWITGIARKEQEYNGIYIYTQVFRIDDLEQGINDTAHYIIIQRRVTKEKNEEENVLKTNALHLLALRDSLLQVVEENFGKLISLKNDCTYVDYYSNVRKQHIRASVDAVKQKEISDRKAKLFHISDLHIKASTKVELNGPFMKKLKETGKKQDVDLLCITGDVVDSGDADASNLQSYYDNANKILLDIIGEIWGNVKIRNGQSVTLLNHDWKKRIIITTGNHDYATMNQYRATLKRRALEAATPTEGEGGTMAKFTYFIEFMVKFLGVPVYEMIKNDLNEIRYYKNMNIKLINVNSVSLASPLRTNKVGVNPEHLIGLMQRKNWDKEDGTTRVCLVHHAPDYKIDYLYDVLGGTPKCSAAKCQNGKDVYGEKCDTCYINQYKKVVDFIEKELITFCDAMLAGQDNQIKLHAINHLCEAYKNSKIEIGENNGNIIECSTCKNMELSKNMQYIIECVRQQKEMQMLSDEKINLFIGMVIERYNIQNADKTSFSKIITTIYGIQYILAGHEHIEREKTFKVTVDGKDKNVILHVAPKSLNNVKTMEKAFITCNTSSSSI